MKKIALLLFGSLFFTILLSCSASKKIEALKPLPSGNNKTAYKSKTSFIALPVEITLKDIEKQVNSNLNGLVYHDSILSDDNCEMKIWKTKAIQLEEKNGMVYSTIPLKIWTKIKYGTDFLGLNDTKEIYMDGVLTLKSKVHLNNWKLNTTSNLEKLEWNESPKIKIAGRLLPITYFINPTLTAFKDRIETEIDNAIDASCDYKSQVYDALEKLSTPFLVDKNYEVWFKLIPIELYVTQANLKDNKITMNMGLKCNMQTIVGEKPIASFDRNNIVLKPVSKMPDNISASLAAVSTFESASAIITKNFKGQEFGSGNKKVTVQKVSIWQKDFKIIVALDLLGSINGTIYLSGYPSYNHFTQEIFFDQLDYVLNTKSVLLKSANWLAKGNILKSIQENCRYSIKENLSEGKKSMEGFLKNYSPMKGVFINGSIQDFEFEKIEMTDKSIIAFISTSGKIKITIDGMD